MALPLPATLEELIGFTPSDRDRVPLPDDVTVPFIAAVAGKTFGKDAAVFLSRGGATDYADHPLQELRFSTDGKMLISDCPGPGGSDASVAGAFLLTEVDADNNYRIVLQAGCKTTFILKGDAINFGVTGSGSTTP